jgi:hypothetical protein
LDGTDVVPKGPGDVAIKDRTRLAGSALLAALGNRNLLEELVQKHGL